MLALIVALVTVGISAYAFKNPDMFHKYKLSPYMVWHRKEWYRMFTHGFLHTDWTHLGINMFVMWSFGANVIFYLDSYTNYGVLFFILLYSSSIIVASLSTLIKHKNNHYYSAVGASGAVSATVFASIFFDPLNPVYLFLIPIPIPGIIFGLAYLAYSHYMAKNSRNNVNHEAHFYGAVYGMLFPLLINVQFIEIFLSKLTA